jgi:hypothetical protein
LAAPHQACGSTAFAPVVARQARSHIRGCARGRANGRSWRSSAISWHLSGWRLATQLSQFQLRSATAALGEKHYAGSRSLDEYKQRTHISGSRTLRRQRGTAPMLEVAANQPAKPLLRRTAFPVKSRKFPCSQGISMGASGVRCFSLHFGIGIEEYQQVGPDLFSRARMRARDGWHRAARNAVPGGRLKRYARCRPLEQRA